MEKRKRKKDWFFLYVLIGIILVALAITGCVWQVRKTARTRAVQRTQRVSKPKAHFYPPVRYTLRQLAKNYSHTPLSVKTNTNLNRNVISKNDPQLIDYVNKQLAKNEFIGTVTVIKDDSIVYQRGFGYANRSINQNNTAASAYQIASVQKGATAMLLMKLVQQGKVSLNDPLSKYYPQIKNGQLVTLKQMMDMTSGAQNIKLPRKLMASEKYIQWTAKHFKIKKEMIGCQDYRPINFVLLAGIVQRVSHKSYYKLFDEEIKRPLKLRNTFFYQQRNNYPQILTSGYNSRAGRWYQPFKESESGFADQFGTGNLYMSNGDLYRMISAFITGKMLKPQYAQMMYSLEGVDSSYSAGVYHLDRDYMTPQLHQPKFAGYHFRGTEFGYETIGDISKNGQNCVILQTNNRNPRRPFNYHTDVNIYHYIMTH